jgi:uncharacterized repeat protein (TIGR03803 family)
MSCKKFLGAAGAALTIVIVLTLALPPAAGAASKYKVLHRFNVTNGAEPIAGLILDAAGNLYGTTLYGGAPGPGTVFKLAPNADGSWTESILHSFNGKDGERPEAGLIFDAAGNLYGTTSAGGALRLCQGDGCGTVFKLTPNADGSWMESILHTFIARPDGKNPYGGLTFDAAGNLYGTTNQGGAYGLGTVFKLAANADGSWTESVLHSFKGSNGAFPAGTLIFDGAGNLYGTTVQGGNGCEFGCGVVFELKPGSNGSWTGSVLHSFKGSDGEYPDAGLIFDKAGNLYGTTNVGGAPGLGTVFKLAPNADGSWTESVLHSFDGSDGAAPIAGLIFDGAGNLYGTASSGGSADAGAVFKLTENADGSWTGSVLHSFRRGIRGRNGDYPEAPLVFDSAGTLYGTTAECGTGSGCKGVVYQITP